MRTMHAALQGRLKMQIPMRHKIMQWFMEHIASVMNRCLVGNVGLTADQRLHGRRANSKAVEVGEKVFDHVPKKLRSKMQLRWKIGIYLGVAGHAEEHYIWHMDRRCGEDSINCTSGGTRTMEDGFRRSTACNTSSAHTHWSRCI